MIYNQSEIIKFLGSHVGKTGKAGSTLSSEHSRGLRIRSTKTFSGVDFIVCRVVLHIKSSAALGHAHPSGPALLLPPDRSPTPPPMLAYIRPS